MGIIKKIAPLLLVSAVALHAEQYTINYKGITLGTIDDLSTVNQLYLKARVTNLVAKLLLGHKYFVFYGGEKPHISDAKYRKDKNNVLFALNEAIHVKPRHKVYPSPKEKKLIIDCQKERCEYVFYRKNRIKGKGEILFDQNGQFYQLLEEKSSVLIKRR